MKTVGWLGWEWLRNILVLVTLVRWRVDSANHVNLETVNMASLSFDRCGYVTSVESKAENNMGLSVVRSRRAKS